MPFFIQGTWKLLILHLNYCLKNIFHCIFTNSMIHFRFFEAILLKRFGCIPNWDELVDDEFVLHKKRSLAMENNSPLLSFMAAPRLTLLYKSVNKCSKVSSLLSDSIPGQGTTHFLSKVPRYNWTPIRAKIERMKMVRTATSRRCITASIRAPMIVFRP